jgi:hypothetical protein
MLYILIAAHSATVNVIRAVIGYIPIRANRGARAPAQPLYAKETPDVAETEVPARHVGH